MDTTAALESLNMDLEMMPDHVKMALALYSKMMNVKAHEWQSWLTGYWTAAVGEFIRTGEDVVFLMRMGNLNHYIIRHRLQLEAEELDGTIRSGGPDT